MLLNNVELDLKTKRKEGGVSQAGIAEKPGAMVSYAKNTRIPAFLLCILMALSLIMPLTACPKAEIIRSRVNKCIELAEDRDIIRATERDSLTMLFNIDYFRRYVQMFDRNDWDVPMDAVAVRVDNFRAIIEKHGKTCGDKVLRSIGERLRTLSREIGGVGSRQGEDTFLIYCPHREDYPGLLARLSDNLTVDESSAGQVRLRIGVYPAVDKKLDIERRFENARAAAGAVGAATESSVGIFDADMQGPKEVQ